MPRYRFAWSNFSPRLLSRLAAALNLGGDPAESLRAIYGARPKANFIQDAWPTLLEDWLPTDPSMLQFVAEEMHELGLGRTEIGIRSKRGRLEYLATCRNAPTLREVVLSAFLAAGETPQLDTPALRDLPTSTETAPDHPEVSTSTGAGHAGEDEQLVVDSLNEWIEETLKVALELDEVFRDEDGDIPIPRGSSVLFIRPQAEGSPFLEIFSPLLQGFEMSPAVYQAVNELNLQVPMAKAMVSGDGTVIVLSAHLLTETLSPTELMFALDMVSGAADYFDTLLQKRFGGSTLMDDDDDAIEV